MPEMDGFEVCRLIKGDQRWQHIPIVLVTALDSKEDLVSGLDAGADEFVSKPVTTLELQARVRSMLRIKKQYDDLMALLQLREDLANMIVHDMRSPLTVILGYSETRERRLRQKLPEEAAPLQKIHRQAQRLQGFANDMLMLTKMAHGQPLLQRALVFEKYEIVLLKQKQTSQVGLGLAFCKMVVEAHRGRIYVEANKPVGSVFVVEI